MSIAQGPIAELPISRAEAKGSGSAPPPRRVAVAKSDEQAVPEPR